MMWTYSLVSIHVIRNTHSTFYSNTLAYPLCHALGPLGARPVMKLPLAAMLKFPILNHCQDQTSACEFSRFSQMHTLYVASLYLDSWHTKLDSIFSTQRICVHTPHFTMYSSRVLITYTNMTKPRLWCRHPRKSTSKVTYQDTGVVKEFNNNSSLNIIHLHDSLSGT